MERNSNFSKAETVFERVQRLFRQELDAEEFLNRPSMKSLKERQMELEVDAYLERVLEYDWKSKEGEVICKKFTGQLNASE